MKFFKKQWVVLLIFLVISLPAVIAFVHPGFPRTDDGNWMIIRLSAFYETFKSGQIPVRWLSRLNNGYGYPVANFLYPGFMYLGIPIALITSSFITTVKILFIFSLIGSGIGMYLWLRRKYEVVPSLIGGLAYLYAPYHLYDATVRGSLGEVLALALVPFVFWAIDKKSLVLTMGFLGLLMISHNTLAILFLPLIVLYIFMSEKEEESQVRRWGGVVLGITSSAFFWVPALSDLSSTVFSQISVSQWDKYFASLDLIIITGIPILLVLLVYLFKFKKEFKNKRVILLFFAVAALSLFMSIPLSGFLWNRIPVGFIQFPFRFLSLTIFSSAVLFSWFVSLFKRKLVLSLIILGVIFFGALAYLKPSAYDYFPEGYYATNQATTTVKDEYMPKWVKLIPQTAPDAKVVITTGTISDLQTKAAEYKFRTTGQKKSTITINQIYFPGWVANVDSKYVSISYTNTRGLIEIPVESGVHTFHVYFSETPIRLVADSITVLSILCVGLLSILRKHKYL